jgi:hypothetical protein
MVHSRLETLVQQPLTIVLGAGASWDYGFPLWRDLRDRFLDEVDRKSPGAEYWMNALTDESRSMRTLDSLTVDADDDAAQTFVRTVSKILVKCEADDLAAHRDGWIELLAGDLLKVGKNPDAMASIFANLNVVTLNYDRSFAHRYGRSFLHRVPELLPRRSIARQALLSKLQRAGVRASTVTHCHGSLGTLADVHDWQKFQEAGVNDSTFVKVNRSYVARYGDVADQVANAWQAPLLSVDDVHLGDNFAYAYANECLQASKNVVIIGLSRAGLEQSALSIPTDANVLCSGDEPIVETAQIIGRTAVDVVQHLVGH